MVQESNTGILEHANDLIAIVGPLITAIVGLIVYAWHKMERGQEKLVDGQDVLEHAIEVEVNRLDEAIDRIERQHNHLNQRLSLLAKEHDIYCSRCPHVNSINESDKVS